MSSDMERVVATRFTFGLVIRGTISDFDNIKKFILSECDPETTRLIYQKISSSELYIVGESIPESDKFTRSSG